MGRCTHIKNLLFRDTVDGVPTLYPEEEIGSFYVTVKGRSDSLRQSASCISGSVSKMSRMRIFWS